MSHEEESDLNGAMARLHSDMHDDVSPAKRFLRKALKLTLWVMAGCFLLCCLGSIIVNGGRTLAWPLGPVLVVAFVAGLVAIVLAFLTD